MLIDTTKRARRNSDSEFREHKLDIAEILVAANSARPALADDAQVVTCSYPFDAKSVSLWRNWVRRDGRVTHGMDPDFVLPFLDTEEFCADALLIMELKHARCQLAIVVVPSMNSMQWSSQSWQLFAHEHIDVNGFFEEESGQTYDQIFDLVRKGLSNEGRNLSRLSLSKMQCLSPGQRKFSEKFVHFNAFFDVSGPVAYSVPGKLNRNIRRNARKLEDAHGPLVLKVAPSRADNMNTFFDVEASGWKDREDSAIRSDEHLRRAYLAAARDDGSSCRAHVFTLWAGNEAVSSGYGLIYDEHISLLKIGFNERFAHYSPGSLLVSEVIKHAVSIGRTRLFLSTYPDWAKRWKPVLRAKKDVHIFSDDRIGQFRYLTDRILTTAKRFLIKIAGKEITT